MEAFCQQAKTPLPANTATTGEGDTVLGTGSRHQRALGMTKDPTLGVTNGYFAAQCMHRTTSGRGHIYAVCTVQGQNWTMAGKATATWQKHKCAK